MGVTPSEDGFFPMDVGYVFQAHFLFFLERSASEALNGEVRPDYVWLPGIIKSNKRPECHITDGYLLKLLRDDVIVRVPADVKRHMAGCSVCAASLAGFRDILRAPDEIGHKHAFYLRQITERLTGHFSHLDKEVDCRTARK